MKTVTLQPLQRYLEGFYGLEPATSVDEFITFGQQGEREALFLRLTEESLELRLRLPEAAKALECSDDHLPSKAMEHADLWAQVIEGVSHFVLLLERARVELPTTHLELELQAEVDKYLMLARPFRGQRTRGDFHERLFESVSYLDPPDSESGARYRFVNRLAARYTAALYRGDRHQHANRQLRRFFRAGQTEKLSMVQAA